MKTIDLEKIPTEVLAKIQEQSANKPEPINNSELVKAFRAEGGQLLHIRPKRRRNGTWSRGMTAAFIIKGNRVTLATSLAHTVDPFCKKNGTKTAIEHFTAGKTVTLPVPKERHPVKALKEAFYRFSGWWM